MINLNPTLDAWIAFCDEVEDNLNPEFYQENLKWIGDEKEEGSTEYTDLLNTLFSLEIEPVKAARIIESVHKIFVKNNATSK